MEEIKSEENKLAKLEEIILEANKRGASDIHLAPRSPVMFRIDGELVARSQELVKPYEIEEIIRFMLLPEQIKELEQKGELDFAYSMTGYSRTRVNVFRQRGTFAMALRLLSFEIPSAKSLGIPQSVMELIDKKRGLVLVTGATGSGKSTTLAAMIDKIAEKYAKTIITLEDPIEYLYMHKQSVVMQREVGQDTQSYANALRAALRQDPDVILVGEMRDLETITTALTAAETGHLVLSTLHTNSAADAVDRVIDVFPPHQQQQVRIQFASVIEAVIAQQLLPMQNSTGRVAAYEVMLASSAIRNLIREGKSFQIPSMIQTSRKEGMQTMDDAIYDLYMKNLVSAETATAYAKDSGAMSVRVAIS